MLLVLQEAQKGEMRIGSVSDQSGRWRKGGSLCFFPVLHSGCPALTFSGCAVEKVIAIKPHTSPCPSVMKARWSSVPNLKNSVEGPCVSSKKARHWTVFRHRAEEFGSLPISVEVVRAVPPLWMGWSRFINQSHGAPLHTAALTCFEEPYLVTAVLAPSAEAH